MVVLRNTLQRLLPDILSNNRHWSRCSPGSVEGIYGQTASLAQRGCNKPLAEGGRQRIWTSRRSRAMEHIPRKSLPQWSGTYRRFLVARGRRTKVRINGAGAMVCSKGKANEQAAHSYTAYPQLQQPTLTVAVLNICFVHPDHRRRGVGSLLVKWGIQKADELGLETFIEAAEPGVPLYLSHGFGAMDEFCIDPKVPEPSLEWKQLKERIPPIRWIFMWRPQQGSFEEGKTSVPWVNDA